MPKALTAKAAFGRAYDVLKTDLGRRACSEGWQGQLFYFVREHGRRPDESEQAVLRAKAASLAEERRSWRNATALAAHQKKAERFERIANGLE